MKYFICTLEKADYNFKSCGNNKVCLGIPAERTERIILVNQVSSDLQNNDHSPAVNELSNQKILVSLPMLFQLKDPATIHGIVLKSHGQAKIVLHTARIENELEIPEESLYQLPEALAEMLKFFKGACFMEQDLILILDPKKIIESLK